MSTPYDPDPLTADAEDKLEWPMLYLAGYDAAIEDCVSAWRSGAVIVAGALAAVFVAGAMLGRRFR